ncbi:hypothetical protein CAPTEDRAFT_190768 [Capitella teleta]|uniref:Pre-rRNA-processing protein TSR2 homolog n=1 Tax=Capitella teleta TaxID=283909 RepID=R7T5G0_CAPTE|nr:hypothetical protein CAPTEDRAFT_190768 [Capitella teleta]|eukprot:ELT88455.1 hypothetical protein CAPTEDRAFT_190768 [Capitella teleta]
MNNEFETVTSDGSLEQVSADICQCFNWCAAGNLAAVEQRLLQLTPAAVAACQGAPGDDNDDDDEGENVQNMEVVEEQPHRASSEQAQEEDDGWTMVKSKRK